MMNTENHVPVEAPRSQLIGTTAVVDGWPVTYVESGSNPAIRHRKYTANYTRVSDRQWKVGRRSFKSRSNALRAHATTQGGAQ
ncbi:hypothetical protein [Stutzerimonas stutzeri]|uniref:Uncharacterized protein n=1 Tax=Stutzerimonas stutzeri TaxID=316 RepID=A0A0D7DZU2_STUST|nr:hypothetical protein [Stutzerimonas stutzeri]KIZ34103.1 hypothetical protein LO50_18400 [Stutzerimonas stutzeri]